MLHRSGISRAREQSRAADLFSIGGTRGALQILVSNRVDTPLTWGICRHVILIPAALVSGDPAVCESALRHEQAHIARCDWIWNLPAEIVCACCWFQPGAWWLRRRLRLESERSCDDRVLLSGIAGPDYAAHLLHILRSVRTSEIAPAMAHSGSMEERMQHILDTHKPRHTQTKWLAVSASLALTLLSIAALRVSARPAEAKAKADAPVLKSERSDMPSQPSKSSLPAANSGMPDAGDLPFAELPSLSGQGNVPAIQPGGTMAQAQPAPTLSDPIAPATPPAAVSPQSNAPATSAQHPNSRFSSMPVVWGDVVDGLQAGFLIQTPGYVHGQPVPLNSKILYQVLVRNTTRQKRVIETECKDFQGFVPYLIPDGDIRKALNGTEIPFDYRAIAVTELVVGYLGYSVELSPGEAVVLPDMLPFYVGDADKNSFVRVEKITPGRNWIVQPVVARSLTPTEAAEDMAAIGSPYGNGINLTVVTRDGSLTARRGARYAVRTGAKRLYAKIPLEIRTPNVDNLPEGKPIVWGEKVGGFQIGARVVPDASVFKVGDTITFQAFGRNLSGKEAQLTVGNYWKVNYKIQVQTLDGKPVYMERDGHNQATEVAGYRAESLGNGMTQEISKAILKITPPLEARTVDVKQGEDDAWVEAVPLKAGRYRVRLVSWGVFGVHNPEPVSAWIPIEVQK